MGGGAPHIASSLVTGAEVAGDDPRFGEKLTREQALVHPRLDEFWMANDMVLTEIREVGDADDICIAANIPWPQGATASLLMAKTDWEIITSTGAGSRAEATGNA